MLCVSVPCVVHGLFVCAVLDDTRHDADVVLRWVGLVTSCVSVRARDCGAMVAGTAALVGMCVMCALGLRKCEELWLRHRRDVECASRAALSRAQ